MTGIPLSQEQASCGFPPGLQSASRIAALPGAGRTIHWPYTSCLGVAVEREGKKRMVRRHCVVAFTKDQRTTWGGIGGQTPLRGINIGQQCRVYKTSPYPGIKQPNLACGKSMLTGYPPPCSSMILSARHADSYSPVNPCGNLL